MKVRNKSFRVGTIVKYDKGGAMNYGVVREKLTTRYKVFVVTGSRSRVGTIRRVPPNLMCAVPPSRIPDAVAVAIARYALLGSK